MAYKKTDDLSGWTNAGSSTPGSNIGRAREKTVSSAPAKPITTRPVTSTPTPSTNVGRSREKTVSTTPAKPIYKRGK